MRDPQRIRHLGPREPRQYATRTVLLLTLGLAALLLLPTIFWNFTYDQGTFAYGGSAILNGERPYVDFWDIKPPNIFYTYAVAFTLFGQSIRAIRIFDYLNALGTIALLFLLATRLWRNTPWRHISGVMAALAFVLQFYLLGDWDTAQAETYSLPLLLGAVLLSMPGRHRDDTKRLALRAFLSGLFIAITFYFKFTNGAYLLVVGASFWLHSGHDRKVHERALLRVVAGFLAGVAVQSLYLLIQGGLLPLWQITTSSTASYVSTNYSGSFTLYHNLKASFGVLDMLWVVVAIIGWSFWAMDDNPRAKHTQHVMNSAMLMLLAVILSYGLVQLQNKGYKYHYTVLLPWMDLLIGAGLGHIARMLHKLDALPRGNNAAIVLITLLTLSYVWTSSAPLHAQMHTLSEVLTGEQSANGYIANDVLADYVLRNTAPSDHIFIFGFEPYVYWKTGRKPANKYLNTIHFKPSYVPPREREELVRSLTENPPKLFLVETEDRYTSQGNSNADSRTTIRERYPEIEKLLSERYTARDTVQHTIAYVLRSP